VKKEMNGGIFLVSGGGIWLEIQGGAKSRPLFTKSKNVHLCSCPYLCHVVIDSQLSRELK